MAWAGVPLGTVVGLPPKHNLLNITSATLTSSLEVALFATTPTPGFMAGFGRLLAPQLRLAGGAVAGSCFETLGLTTDPWPSKRAYKVRWCGA